MQGQNMTVRCEGGEGFSEQGEEKVLDLGFDQVRVEPITSSKPHSLPQIKPILNLQPQRPPLAPNHVPVRSSQLTAETLLAPT